MARDRPIGPKIVSTSLFIYLSLLSPSPSQSIYLSLSNYFNFFLSFLSFLPISIYLSFSFSRSLSK